MKTIFPAELKIISRGKKYCLQSTMMLKEKVQKSSVVNKAILYGDKLILNFKLVHIWVRMYEYKYIYISNYNLPSRLLIKF